MKIVKPTLVVDLVKAEQNIVRMLNKFRERSIEFRPHFKTHQSLGVAELYRKNGVTKCTVSSVGMAKYFADGGWKDICIAFPANILEAKEINSLSEIVKLYIIVDSKEKVSLFSAKISANI